MADRPILFSAPMVRALLEGRKTQTRRTLTEANIYADISSEAAEDFKLRGWTIFRDKEDTLCAASARISSGDRLWVREAHYLTDNGDEEYAVYAADGNDAVGEHLEQISGLERRFPNGPWARHKKLRPSIHMPRWASRITLTVTEVRVERLQDISEADAIAEGWPPENERATAGEAQIRDAYPIGWYAALWESINGAGSWDANPFVAAYTFTVALGNIDALSKASAP